MGDFLLVAEYSNVPPNAKIQYMAILTRKAEPFSEFHNPLLVILWANVLVST